MIKSNGYMAKFVPHYETEQTLDLTDFKIILLQCSNLPIQRISH